MQEVTMKGVVWVMIAMEKDDGQGKTEELYRTQVHGVTLKRARSTADDIRHRQHHEAVDEIII